MLAILSRLFSPRKRRSLDAAAGGRRWEHAGSLSNLNSDILAGGTTIRRRAAYQARNNPHIARAVNALIANAVGCGVKPQFRHSSADVQEAVNRAFTWWTDHADIAGRMDFYGLQAAAFRSMVEAGEAFIRLRVAERPAAGIVPLRLELIPPDQVPADLHKDLANGVRIRAGVEFDANGKRRKYHIYRERPGEGLAHALETVRVPAEDLIHLFEPLAPGQVRGLSWLAPVLLRLHELDQYEDAQLVRQKVAALFAGFITDPEGGAGGMTGTDAGNGVQDTGLEPGTLQVLPPGKSIEFSKPADPGQSYDAFVKGHLRAIAAGLGVTYEQMTGDLSGVNYSSIRAGLIEFRRRIEQIQHNVLVHQFCRPVWDRWVRLAVLAGVVELPGFDRDPAPYLTVKWLPPRFDWVDPQKDIAAEIAAMQAGIKSRSEVINERGYDPEEVDAEIAADQARAKRLGLNLSNTPKESPDAGNA